MTNYMISCNFREVRMLGKRCITMKYSSIHITGPEFKKKNYRLIARALLESYGQHLQRQDY